MDLQEQINFQVASVLLELRGSFKWNDFKVLPTLEDKLKYAQANLQELGRGSSRAAFLLSNRYVLKIALPNAKDKGVGQNLGEIQVFSNPVAKNTVASIYDYDKNGEWIVSELARPVSSKEEFQRLTGVTWDDFVSIVRNHKVAQEETQEIENGITTWTRRLKSAQASGNQDLVQRAPKKIENLKQRLEKLKRTLQAPVVAGSLALINKVNVMPGDVWELDHWAKTASGRVILIDYGFTRDLVDLYK
jgi:hypothetical protein